MSTRIEGREYNQDGKLIPVNTILLTHSENWGGNFRLSLLEGNPAHLEDSDRGAVVDLFTTVQIASGTLNLLPVKGEDGSWRRDGGVILIDGTLQIQEAPSSWIARLTRNYAEIKVMYEPGDNIITVVPRSE